LLQASFRRFSDSQGGQGNITGQSPPNIAGPKKVKNGPSKNNRNIIAKMHHLSVEFFVDTPFLQPCSPDLNPNEMNFSKLKVRILGHPKWVS
jgi:transposase